MCFIATDCDSEQASIICWLRLMCEVKMASETSELLLCYNKGCGNKYDPKDNKQDSCCFHPGNPFFHDAYKGWSCCNKKTIDFTEFLKMKGCTISYHSNVKPPEVEKPVVPKTKSDEVYEYVAPTNKVPAMQRPPFNSPLTKVQPEISNLLKSQTESLSSQQPNVAATGVVQIGTNCKNSGCKAVYEGPEIMKTDCVHHSGVPVFHEGLKFWSCCKKKTTDFAVFLDQLGCSTGEHVWIKKNTNVQSNCRYDWHQTGSHVVLSVYAKKCDPYKSTVELNPIRLKLHLELPAENIHFNKDFELFGIIDVDKSEVSMLPTKVEVKMKKAEPGRWAKLDIPHGLDAELKGDANKDSNSGKDKVAEVADDDLVDLTDI